ncbi:hypothetical protein EJ04DRAFT_86982 [Polyplosphaeria fusca]|uniref:Uncharacterized protein n=1 Tax=Polyplosphaeria fusca TaxID=682080 RepID=A0A9P4R7C6_9PLEO|nr:hypothetical protein EJ04DRAFT_86982 [Polyplosphaeria fusca]
MLPLAYVACSCTLQISENCFSSETCTPEPERPKQPPTAASQKFSFPGPPCCIRGPQTTGLGTHQASLERRHPRWGIQHDDRSGRRVRPPWAFSNQKGASCNYLKPRICFFRVSSHFVALSPFPDSCVGGGPDIAYAMPQGAKRTGIVRAGSARFDQGLCILRRWTFPATTLLCWTPSALQLTTQ